MFLFYKDCGRMLAVREGISTNLRCCWMCFGFSVLPPKPKDRKQTDLSLTLTQRRAVTRGWRGSCLHSDSHPGPRGSCPGPQLSATSGTPRGPDPQAAIPAMNSWRFRPEIFYSFRSVVDPDPLNPHVFGTSGSVIICTDPDPAGTFNHQVNL